MERVLGIDVANAATAFLRRGMPVVFPPRPDAAVRRLVAREALRCGEDGHVWCGDRDHTPADSLAIVLGQLRKQACVEVGDTSRAVLAVPSDVLDSMRELVTRAAQAAGLLVVDVLDAAAAVCLALRYVDELPEGDRTVLVVDVGTATVLRLADETSTWASGRASESADQPTAVETALRAADMTKDDVDDVVLLDDSTSARTAMETLFGPDRLRSVADPRSLVARGASIHGVLIAELTCPECGALAQTSATDCPACAGPLTGATVVACPACDAYTAATEKACLVCGADLVLDAAPGGGTASVVPPQRDATAADRSVPADVAAVDATVAQEVRAPESEVRAPKSASSPAGADAPSPSPSRVPHSASAEPSVPLLGPTLHAVPPPVPNAIAPETQNPGAFDDVADTTVGVTPNTTFGVLVESASADRGPNRRRRRRLVTTAGVVVVVGILVLGLLTWWRGPDIVLEPAAGPVAAGAFTPDFVLGRDAVRGNLLVSSLPSGHRQGQAVGGATEGLYRSPKNASVCNRSGLMTFFVAMWTRAGSGRAPPGSTGTCPPS